MATTIFQFQLDERSCKLRAWHATSPSILQQNIIYHLGHRGQSTQHRFLTDSLHEQENLLINDWVIRLPWPSSCSQLLQSMHAHTHTDPDTNHLYLSIASVPISVGLIFERAPSDLQISIIILMWQVNGVDSILMVTFFWASSHTYAGCF
jgi:hypothetical protein